MKILIMDTLKSLSRDGSAIHRWELARNLSKLGCEVHVISISYTNTKTEGVHIYPLTKKSKSKYITQLIKLVKRHRFDIVYARNTMIGVIGFLIKKMWKSKLVFEVNGISSEELRLIENQLSTESKRLRSIIKVLQYLEFFVIRKADAVIAVTQGIKDYLINHGVDKNKVWVIENGANTELFKPIKDGNVLKKLRNRLRIDDNGNIVLFVGNLAPWQGIEYLLRAATIIIKRNPKTKFLIVGDGIMRNKLKSLVKELNIVEDVIFTGTVPYENVPEYINISDVCVAPFTHVRNESMGLSPLKIYEYLACGKPVVASNIKGVGDLLRNSNSGIEVVPEDPTELANAIIKLLKDEQLMEQMGDYGRKLVVKNYSWEITAKKTIDVFRGIIKWQS